MQSLVCVLLGACFHKAQGSAVAEDAIKRIAKRSRSSGARQTNARGNIIGPLVISQVKMSDGRPAFHVKDYCSDQVANAAKLVRKKTREAKFVVRASRAPGTE